MGITSSKPAAETNSLVNMLRQYRTLKERSTDHVTVLENIYNPSLVVEMRHLKYAREDQLQERMSYYEKLKSIVHPSILRIIGLNSSKLD